jgi:general secretion pathway protein B
MSYILDALRKAERERGITQVPNLMTVHDFRPKSRHRIWLLIGVLMLCAAALAWYFLPGHRTITGNSASGAGSRAAQQSADAAAAKNPDLRAITPAANLTNEPAAPDTRAAGITQPQRAIVLSRAVPKKPGGEQRGLAPASAQPVPERSSPKPAPVSPVTAAPAPQPPPSPARSAAGESTSAPQAAAANPASLSEAMAMMNLSILLYSDTPAERIVFINGRKYVEGDHIDGKYFIENITLEGAVLSYQGERGILRPKQK